ncbi:TonB-dependent receptor plug domain-containing protein [Flavobacterium sp.]|uniref:TonB-dependent receptor plug domain-containing protein n=1 Tax=Flavobacterium sp. TaxID=239 RepID=UPI001B71EC21|nr:TonB-dependent receptor plug domain-containing protein [Flavobacterium sp.]MBP6181274.1 TonB-dependent receptor plug domain-containing protein [Flavobacterium sp.]
MKISKTLLAICFLFAFMGYAQNKIVGKVVDFKNKPVANSKIFLDSINSNVETNKDGNFEVSVPENVITINVYSDKYGLLSSKYNNETTMNFIFLETENSKKNKKGSKVSLVYSKYEQKYQVINSQGINAENDKNLVIYTSIFDMIRGKLAGVTVSVNNKITIRGLSSLHYAAEPLFVVDGVIVSSIDYIFPNNVKKISVLKGADASIYGAQGTSGVIVITLKK